MIRGLNDVATAAAVRDTGRRRADSVEGRIKKLLKANVGMGAGCGNNVWSRGEIEQEEAREREIE